MKEYSRDSLKKAVLKVFDSYDINQYFFANELREKAAAIYPPAINRYPNSILMILRRHRREFYHWADRHGKLVKTGNCQ